MDTYVQDYIWDWMSKLILQTLIPLTTNDHTCEEKVKFREVKRLGQGPTVL